MSLFDLMRKTNEAQAVRLGIPVSRQFSDDELTDSMQAMADAERKLYGMTEDERLGKLGEEEQRMLNELNRRLIPFRVTVTLPDRTEQINILATDACHANIRVVEMVFGDFDAEKPQAFKVKVEPVQTRSLRRAA